MSSQVCNALKKPSVGSFYVILFAQSSNDCFFFASFLKAFESQP